MPANPFDPKDPLGLNEVDRQIRLNKLRDSLGDLGMQDSGVSEDCPPEIEEGYLISIEALERSPISTQFEELTKAGVELPPPDSLSDEALTTKLWEVINRLAATSTYLHNTDHLSDRELYEHLWSDSLREENHILPPDSGWNHHIDILGGCSEEDIEIGLRYYQSEEERQSWVREWPDTVLPPREDPPYDRDRHLPQPPEPVPPEGLDDDDMLDPEPELDDDEDGEEWRTGEAGEDPP